MGQVRSSKAQNSCVREDFLENMIYNISLDLKEQDNQVKMSQTQRDGGGE